MGNSATYNSVDLGGANYLWMIDGNRFVDPPIPRVNRVPLVAADGEATQGATFGARVGEVTGLVFATSFANLKTQRNNIEAALSVGQEGPKALSFDAFSGKTYQARILEQKWSEETPTTIRLTVVFHAAQPWPTGTPVTGDDDPIDVGGTTL